MKKIANSIASSKLLVSTNNIFPYFHLLWLVLCTHLAIGQSSPNISGYLMDAAKSPIEFANIALYQSADSTLTKVTTSNEKGLFEFHNINIGSYYLEASFVGYDDYKSEIIDISSDKRVSLSDILLKESAVKLETAVITARRALVEIKPDRTVFNVQGTINSTGDNGLELLRKAPGVLLDNNNTINVLGRSGALIYIDGKRLPLEGDDLVGYLQSLTSDQIDRIDIITNPGAKYEAEGSAGIIDIKLKKNENYGANASLSTNLYRSRVWGGNTSINANYRNGKVNTFGQLQYNNRNNLLYYFFDDYQNETFIKNENQTLIENENVVLRVGTDYFISDNHTIGFIISGMRRAYARDVNDENLIYPINNLNNLDSILIAKSKYNSDFDSRTYNLNYRYESKSKSLNIDLDYGTYITDNLEIQPNNYFAEDRTTLLTQIISEFETPRDIKISTFKIDYETNWMNGKLGIGTKLSRVTTDNSFLFLDVLDNSRTRNDLKSNLFLYDEKVYASYLNYERKINEQLSFTSGLRLEKTVARGDLEVFHPDLEQPSLDLNYLSAFPSAGITYTINPQFVYSLNYSRRINRPNYNVLNPFRIQVNELYFISGNPNLVPEIVNNLELGLLLNQRYNFKIAYSKTLDQLTRLIGPDESDPRAKFINWDNLSEQKIYNASISLPFELGEKWSSYFDLSGGFIDNQAKYSNGIEVDVQSWTYNIYQQHTIKLPNGYTGEISGWFAGPNLFGATFRNDTSWSLNLGLQKKFLNDQLNIKISAQDIFNQAFWSGVSEFNGLTNYGRGEWDSRRVACSISYNFGNSKVKSRKRKIGLEGEADRI